LDKRLTILTDWLSNDLALTVLSIETASADASFRRYFRAIISSSCASANKLPTTFIIMDSPPEHEDNPLFVACTETLKKCGINVPNIYRQNLTLGFLILTDLGNTVYNTILNPQSVDNLYQDAFQALLTMQFKGQQNAAPAYDKNKLIEEMSLFDDWYIKHYHQTHLNKEDQKTFQKTIKLLSLSAIEQPQVLVHRDFHSRNLLFNKEQNPAVIDYQDMVIGPITYDLVSLLKDCYIQWPVSDVENWAENYLHLSREKGIHEYTDTKQWQQWFDWMGVQRHLKVLGIFSRLFYRDNKDQYLADMPLTHGYLMNTCAKYDELQDLEKILKKYPTNKL